MQLADLTKDEPRRFELGDDRCAVLRALRARHDWPRFIGTTGPAAYTWHRETAAMLRSWLNYNDATA